jgi:uncharacterized glyoxalase superfamily protein PhnB
MKTPPAGWPRISPALFYDDASAAIEFLCRAFGFEVRLRVEGEGGRIEHSELVFGEGLIMVGSTGGKDTSRPLLQSPRSTGGVNTQTLCVAVDDADAHCAHARAAGATIAVDPKTTDYGDDYWADRTYEAVDPEGHRWWFMQRVRDQVARG